MRARTRPAFTLVETLVVIAILALAAGLTLAGIQRVRAAAARTQCLNNVHQLGLAVHGYHGVHNRLPTGVTATDDKTQPQPYQNWQARLLPHLEQTELWNRTLAAYVADPVFWHHPPHTPAGTVVKAFLCPMDGRTLTPQTHKQPTGDVTYGYTAFLGVIGYNPAQRDGLLYYGSKHSFADVTDGTSNTLLAGERPPSADLILGWWYAGWGQSKDGDGDGVLGVRSRNRDRFPECPTDRQHFGPGKVSNNCDAFHFWSLHPGGAHFLFADGSGRFLTYSADPWLPALASRAGGEAASVPD